MVLATYVASLNQCHVAVLDAEGEPAAVMEGLVSEGILGSYEEISLTDYATAMNQINQAIQGELSRKGAWKANPKRHPALPLPEAELSGSDWINAAENRALFDAESVSRRRRDRFPHLQ